MTTTKQDKAIEKVRPLNATQTRNLEKLVKEDFLVLEQDLRMQAARARYEEIEQAKADANPERQEEIKNKAYDVLNTARTQLRALADEATALGLRMEYPSVSEDRVRMDDTRLTTKVREIEQRSARQLELALSLMSRERSKVQRKVLIASITASTEDVLNTLPRAEDLFNQAVEEMQNPSAEIEARSRVFFKGQWVDREFARQRGYTGV